MAKKSNTELAVVENETDMIPVEESGLYVHTLRKPIEFEGERYTSLSFDFERLTANDCLKVEREMRAQGHNVLVDTIDSDYLMRLSARACKEKVGFDLLTNLSMADFRAIRDKARSFLTGMA